MTRMLSTAIVALTLGFGGMAVAQSQLEIQARTTLERYGYEGVDVEALSTEQLALFETYFAGEEEFDNEVSARNRIDEILMMEEGTSLYISPDMQAMLDDTTVLEENARALLDRAGFEEVDVRTLTNAQLTQLWFVQERDDVMNNPASLENFIQGTVLNES